MNQGTTAPDHILQVGFGFWASKTLLSAIELEVFTELAKHPLPLNDLQGDWAYIRARPVISSTRS